MGWLDAGRFLKNANASNPSLTSVTLTSQVVRYLLNINLFVSLSSTITMCLPLSSSSLKKIWWVFTVSDSENSQWKENEDPTLRVLSSFNLPFINSTKRWEIAKPKPVPPYFLVVEASTCEKDLNNFFWSSFEIP